MTKNNKNNFKYINDNIGLIRLILLIIIAVFLIVFTYKQIKLIDSQINYMTFNSTQLNHYDQHITNKFYYSPSDYNGIKVDFDTMLSNDLLECVIGGGFNVLFYNNSTQVGEIKIKDEERHILNVPDSAVSSGYNSIIFTPTSGKIIYISYIAPLLNQKDNQVLQTVSEREFKMSTYYPQNGHSGLVSALFSHIISANDNEIVLDVVSANNELNSTLISIVNGEGKKIAKFEDYTQLPKYVEGDSGLVFNLKVLNKNYILSDLYLKYQLDYSSEPELWPINPYQQIDDIAYNSTLMRETDTMSDFDNLTINSKNEVTFKDIDVTLSQSLFIPKGYSLKLKEGQNINLTNNAIIVCYDYVEFKGTEKSPITFTSNDNSLYSGIIVMKASQESTLDYVYFDNLGEVKSGIWQLTGAVTFYESDVIIKNCKFLNNRSEDGLNSVRCYIEVHDTLFENTFQDAYDSDFCTGIFNNVTFINSGNDGFDVSTSTFTLYDCTFIDTYDKAISTGENSTVTVYGVDIQGAQTGLSAKDLSILTVENANITDVFVGICVYQKKPEFGASEVYITNYNLTAPYDFDYIIEKQDTVIVNGKQLVASNNKKQEIIIQRMIEEIEI